MAAGKSTIGKKLARKLLVPFYDIDELIVKSHGAVGDIFYNEGEAVFREYEFAAIAQVLDAPAGIIALGGGAVTHDPTLNLLKKRTFRIFVKVPPEQILARLRRSRRVRPLLGPAPSLSKIRQLYAQRMPRYAHADFTVEADDMSATNVADKILDWLHRKNIRLA